MGLISAATVFLKDFSSMIRKADPCPHVYEEGLVSVRRKKCNVCMRQKTRWFFSPLFPVTCDYIVTPHI